MGNRNEEFDNVFMGMLQHCGKIEPFIDVIFNFLSRRTDFFHLMHKRDDKLGFPPGVAEKMLIKIFEKYQEKVLKNDPIYMKWKENQKNKGGSEKAQQLPNFTTEQEKIEGKIISDDSITITTPITTTESDPINSSGDPHPTNEKEITNAIKSCDQEAPANEKKDTIIKNNESDDCFNGGRTSKYSWSQSITDVDLKIPIPPFLKTSKELSIEIRSQSINVSLKKDPPADSGLDSKVLLAGTLKEKIRCDESLWSLIPGEHIAINLEKFHQKWWDGLLDGDDEIDRSSIDTTQHVHDFDEQTQCDIRKVMYDRDQKMMGKPTSEEQKTHSLLEKAWDAEGSPFKGSPFDPSRVNISGNGC